MTEQTKPTGAPPEILIVEDSPVEAELLRRCLSKAGYQVTVTKDGEEGLQAARARRPALVVSDIRMPLMDGYQLCREIKYDEALWNIPVILLTILSEPEDIMEAINSGSDSYIVKPFVEASLLERIRALLATPIRRKRAEERRSEEVEYNGKRYTITGGSQQVLNLLLSVYENTLTQNRDLTRIQTQLNLLNESLDDQVRERTAELVMKEQKLKRANRALMTLSAGNVALVRATNEEELLQNVTRIIVGIGGYRMARVSYADDNPEKSLRRVAWAGVGEYFNGGQSLTWADTENGQVPIAQVIRSGTPHICQDIASDPHFAPWKAAALAQGYTSNIGLPLSDGRRIFGGLSIYSSEKDAFNDEEIPLLIELANDLSYGIATLRTRAERERSESLLAKQLEELRRWHQATLGREMRTIELKREVNELLGQAGQPPRYPSVEPDETTG